MIRRRSFLIGFGSVVAAPAFGRLTLPTAEREVHATLDDASLSTPAPVMAGSQHIALRIDGWDPAADSGDVWVQINSSWRATWR
jgi:hypothetical protein